MTIATSDQMADLQMAVTEIARSTSSTQLALPAAAAANHLLGYIMRGVVHAQNGDTAAGVTASVYTWRHPNCDFLIAVVRPTSLSASTGSIAIQAGTGATSTATVYAATTTGEGDEIVIVAPWGGGDSGYLEVSITATNCGIGSIQVAELHRPTLGDYDYRVELVDATYPLAGLRSDETITDSAEAGVYALVEETKNAWDLNRRQAASWWTTGASSAYGTSWMNPFTSSWEWRHRARRQQTEMTRDYRVYLYTWHSSGLPYDVRVSTMGDSVQFLGLTNVVPAWTMLDGLAVNATADDTFKVEMRVPGGVGSCYIRRFSAIEDGP